jgi:hypothetical protein
MPDLDPFRCLIDQADDQLQPYLEIAAERVRQHEVRNGQPGDVADPNTSNHFRLAVLTEEVGEVARAIIDDEGDERLAEELVQVAAVAVAWLQSRE